MHKVKMQGEKFIFIHAIFFMQFVLQCDMQFDLQLLMQGDMQFVMKFDMQGDMQ